VSEDPGLVDVPAGVVMDTAADAFEVFPAASYAVTVYVYAVDADSPLSE
jgi:hypothetical protein